MSCVISLCPLVEMNYVPHDVDVKLTKIVTRQELSDGDSDRVPGRNTDVVVLLGRPAAVHASAALVRYLVEIIQF